jgi:putative transposase
VPASKAEVYLHFIWTTHQRTPLVSPDVEEAIYACIVNEARRLGGWVYAIGGMPDHVHLVVKMPTKVSPAQLMQQVKGVSSAFARDQLFRGKMFRWQEGYGVFSISRSHRDRVIAYVQNQKQRHAKAKVWEDWESPEADEEAGDVVTI